ncbi:hypothetical protein KM043_010116 [Ampulex compressa]|nr:hypothetical protein KM043_010116 [Ampulex compressa]
MRSYRFARRKGPSTDGNGRASWSRLSRSSPDATSSQYRVSPQVELHTCRRPLAFRTARNVFYCRRDARSVAGTRVHIQIYSNTVPQWSYQWGKQKLVCKRTYRTATQAHHVLDPVLAGEGRRNPGRAWRRECRHYRIRTQRRKVNKWSIGARRRSTRSSSSDQRSSGP